MPEAWLVRSNQRKDFQEVLKAGTHLFLGIDRQDRLLPLARVCIQYLETRQLPDMTDEETFFVQEILTPTAEFSRADEERDIMIATFLRWLIKEIVFDFHAKLQRLEFRNPRIIYHAGSAMDQI